MASHLVTKITSVSSLFHSSRLHNLRILIPLCHFSTQIKQKEDVPFIAQYLISSFGFSEDRALRVASDRKLARIENPDRPDSVIRFLKDNGLTDIQIKKAISLAPQLLSTSVNKTLEPCACEVIAGGFTRETLIRLILSNPVALTYKNLLSRLQFWSNFVGNNEEALLKVIKNRVVINVDIDKGVIPGISLLREYGLPDQQIAKVIMKTDYFLLRNLHSTKLLFEQIDKFGIPRGSPVFLECLIIFGTMKKDTFNRKVEFFKTNFGWSQEDINLAINKCPKLLSYSEEKVSSTMDFLVKKVGLNPRSIASRSWVFSRSLEKTLLPRHYVLNVLKSKGLKNRCSFLTLSFCSEGQFIEKYILAYKEELPDLGKAYAAACAGKIPLS